MKIAYSFGSVDLLHIGHINVLREAKLHADRHVFGLVGDEIVYQKAFAPTENLRRLYERYPEAEITLYHGDNWDVLPAEEYLRGIGGRVILSQYYAKFSPENIRRLLVAEGGAPRGRTGHSAEEVHAEVLHQRGLQDRLPLGAGGDPGMVCHAARRIIKEMK